MPSEPGAAPFPSPAPASPSRLPERLAVAGLWALAGLAALTSGRIPTAPDPTPPLERMVEPIARGRAVALSATPAGDLWFVTGERAVRFAAGAQGAPAAHAPVERPGGERPPGVPLGPDDDPISAAHVDASGALWIGSRHGAVWSRQGETWRERKGGFRAAGRPISAIATRGDVVYVAARGLWRTEPAGDFVEVRRFRNAALSRIASHPQGGVALVVRGAVWRDDGTHWREVWRPGRSGPAVTALAVAADSALLIGTENGLLRMDRRGRARRELEGMAISAVATGADGVEHAAVRGGSLYARYAGAWRRIADARGRGLSGVVGLAPGPGGRLWLSLADGRLLRVGPSYATPLVSAR